MSVWRHLRIQTMCVSGSQLQWAQGGTMGGGYCLHALLVPSQAYLFGCREAASDGHENGEAA